MSAATARKSNARARKPAPRKKVRQVGWMDRILRTLPLTQDDVQRILTGGILALAVVIAIVVASWFGIPQAAYRQFGEVSAKAGFEVRNIETEGMKRADQLKVYDMVLSEMDKPLLLVDLEGIQTKLESYGWFKEVTVSRRLPETLVVTIVERKPTAVWQRGGKLSLLDDEGNVLDNIDASKMGNLPVINGDNANRQVESLAKLLDRAQSLKGQVVAANWVGNRRWDIKFRTGETLALPEGEDLAAEALVNFTRMDGIHRLLGRDLIYFDLRDPDRAYLRRAPKTLPEDKARSDGKSAKSGGDSKKAGDSA